MSNNAPLIKKRYYMYTLYHGNMGFMSAVSETAPEQIIMQDPNIRIIWYKEVSAMSFAQMQKRINEHVAEQKAAAQAEASEQEKQQNAQPVESPADNTKH